MLRLKLFAILAAFTSRANIVQLLLDRGADMSDEDYYGRLHWTVRRKQGMM